MDPIERRAARVIREYDGQGWHRTGTLVDRQSAEWLAGLVRETGLEPRLFPFRLARVDPADCYIEVDGRRLEGVPLFDCSYTDAGGVEGRLGGLEDGAEIALFRGAVNDHQGARQARESGSYRGIVFVTMGRSPGLAPSNAEYFLEPYGPPVLQVAREEGDWLSAAAERRARCRLVVEAGRTPAEAFDVMTSVRGRSPELPPLWVMTPRSGWWNCCGERGGGIVCWLEVMRAVKEAGPERDVHFIATSGHELGHLGLESYLLENPATATEALLWVHFGANIGAATAPSVRIFSADAGLEARTLAALRAEGISEVVSAPPGTPPGGEARNIHRRGGRFITLVGGNAHFHLPSDRWPAAVDIPSIARQARAFRALCSELASASGV
jgi:hypothetical protein